MNERQPNSQEHEAWWAADVISEAFFTAITGDRYELAAIDRNRSRYDPVIICMNFNSYASMVIFFITPVFFLFCFWKRNFIYYTSVSCVWFLLPWVSLQSNFQTRIVYFVFPMRIFVSAHVIITSIRAPGMFQTFVWFFCCYSAACFSRISLSINGNKGREKSEKW